MYGLTPDMSQAFDLVKDYNSKCYDHCPSHTNIRSLNLESES